MIKKTREKEKVAFCPQLPEKINFSVALVGSDIFFIMLLACNTKSFFPPFLTNNSSFLAMPICLQQGNFQM